MKIVRVIQWAISHQHAVRMMKKLNQKKHADLGFFYEYEDFGNCIRASGVKEYSDYSSATQGGVLTVYREVAEAGDKDIPVCYFQQDCIPLAQMKDLDHFYQYLRGRFEDPNAFGIVDRMAIKELMGLYECVLLPWDGRPDK